MKQISFLLLLFLWSAAASAQTHFTNQIRLLTPAKHYSGVAIAILDMDGDGRDDTPSDVHYDAGMGCIDCHNSVDLHGGDVTNPNDTKISSHFEEETAITCQACHGTVSAYAPTQTAAAWDGVVREVAIGPKGNLLRHVVKESDGNYYLYSKLTGVKR